MTLQLCHIWTFGCCCSQCGLKSLYQHLLLILLRHQDAQKQNKQTKKEQLILPEKVIRTEITESKTLKLRSLSNPSTYSLCILPIRYPIPQPRVLQLLVVIGNNDLLTFWPTWPQSGSFLHAYTWIKLSVY